MNMRLHRDCGDGTVVIAVENPSKNQNNDQDWVVHRIERDAWESGDASKIEASLSKMHCLISFRGAPAPADFFDVATDLSGLIANQPMLRRKFRPTPEERAEDEAYMRELEAKKKAAEDAHVSSITALVGKTVDSVKVTPYDNGFARVSPSYDIEIKFTDGTVADIENLVIRP